MMSSLDDWFNFVAQSLGKFVVSKADHLGKLFLKKYAKIFRGPLRASWASFLASLV
jgi:hypothetical protein